MHFGNVQASPRQTVKDPLIAASCHSPAESCYHGNGADQLDGRALWPQESWPLALESSEEGGRGEECGPCFKTVKALHWLAIICPFRSPICVIGILTNWTFCTLLAAPLPVYTGQSVLLAGVGVQWWSLDLLFEACEKRPDVTSTSADHNQLMGLCRWTKNGALVRNRPVNTAKCGWLGRLLRPHPHFHPRWRLRLQLVTCQYPYINRKDDVEADTLVLGEGLPIWLIENVGMWRTRTYRRR